MPDLFQTLRSTDLDFLRRVARGWKIELNAQEQTSALDELMRQMKEESSFSEITVELPARAAKAWAHLIERRGRESWSIFTRQFGELRVFGVAKRIRENPNLHPASAVEELWYRGLIGRAFLDLPPEPQEYAYIPDEFLAFLGLKGGQAKPITLRPASSFERKFLSPASDGILDDATDLLAALRMNRPAKEIFHSKDDEYIRFADTLLLETGLLTDPSTPDAAKVKDFLAKPRPEALQELFNTWFEGKKINDLRMLPGLLFEGNWINDPLPARRLVLEVIKGADTRTWWSLSAFINQVKDNQPDFQRPAGDYDSWFIRDAQTNEHLHGVAHWDRIDGALLTYLVCGPLHWLSAIDLARNDKEGPVTAFKLSPFGADLLNGRTPLKCRAEDGIIAVGSDGVIHVPQSTPRAIRYQVSRFCIPLASVSLERKYHITPASLKAAAEQGLKVSHLLQLFQQARVRDLPPHLVQQLERWEKYGVEAAIEKVIVLRLARPELLPLLQKNARASQCISSVLNNQTIVLKAGKVEQMQQSLADLGLLADVKPDSDV